LFLSTSSADLVPVYSFGENDLLNQVRFSSLNKFQQIIFKWSGIAPIVFYGRGILQYSFGLMPYRVPVTLVGA
jgi:hypothetical protein